jgi:hypothetical protein
MKYAQKKKYQHKSAYKKKKIFETKAKVEQYVFRAEYFLYHEKNRYQSVRCSLGEINQIKFGIAMTVLGSDHKDCITLVDSS